MEIIMQRTIIDMLIQFCDIDILRPQIFYNLKTISKHKSKSELYNISHRNHKRDLDLMSYDYDDIIESFDTSLPYNIKFIREFAFLKRKEGYSIYEYGDRKISEYEISFSELYSKYRYSGKTTIIVESMKK